MNLHVSRMPAPPAGAQSIEIVERKGIGHPDTICDALAEELSLALSRFYLDHAGRILHHNVDKTLLWAGTATPRYGGGEVLAPMEIHLAGRATLDLAGKPVPVAELAADATRGWLRRQLPGLDPGRHVRIHSHVRPGAPALVSLGKRLPGGAVPLANDSAIGVGFAPLSVLERVVLAAEAALNPAPGQTGCPAAGEDVKVLGVRRDDSIRLIVACAFRSGQLAGPAEYLDAREQVRRIVADAAGRTTDLPVEVEINTADDPATGNVYLTVTGTSAESGDDGQTGRGNRVNGLITPCRPMSMEAAAGKNPRNHPGKLYQVAACDIARHLVAEIEDVSDAEVWLVSAIGRPVTEPELAHVRLLTWDTVTLALVEPLVEQIVRRELDQVPELWRRLLAREVRLF